MVLIIIKRSSVIDIYTHEFKYTYTQIDKHEDLYVYTHLYTHTCAHTDTHTYTQHTHLITLAQSWVQDSQ